MSCPRLCFVRYVTVRNVSMTNEMHNSYKQFLFHSTLLYMFRTNLVIHQQEHGVIYCITQYNRYNRAYSMIVLCNTVYYAVILMMNDQIRSKHVEQTKYCGIKIAYKNCASRWSLTHCIMMHGAYNVTICLFSIIIFELSDHFYDTYDKGHYVTIKVTVGWEGWVLEFVAT